MISRILLEFYIGIWWVRNLSFVNLTNNSYKLTLLSISSSLEYVLSLSSLFYIIFYFFYLDIRNRSLKHDNYQL